MLVDNYENLRRTESVCTNTKTIPSQPDSSNAEPRPNYSASVVDVVLTYCLLDGQETVPPVDKNKNLLVDLAHVAISPVKVKNFTGIRVFCILTFEK